MPEMIEVRIGERGQIDEDSIVGYAYNSFNKPTIIGDDATIRAGTIIYAATDIGDRLTTGHRAVIREHSKLGENVLVGTSVTIDGHTQIGSNVSIQTGAYIPANTTIGDHVFLGPHAVLTNDRYPVRSQYDEQLRGPTIEDRVTIGANATILPDITIGEGAFIAAGAIVTEDVPAYNLAMGAPADHQELPAEIARGNVIT